MGKLRRRVACWLAVMAGGLAGCVGSGGDGAADVPEEKPPAQYLEGVVVGDDVRISSAEYSRLRDEARQREVARVWVSYARGVVMVPDAEQREANAVEARQKFASLMARLGDEVWRRNALELTYPEMGSARLYVTPRGLEILLTAPEVRTMSGASHDSRMHQTPAQEDAIEQALDSRGEVELSVVLNVEAQDFAIDADGQLRFSPSAELDRQAADLRERLLAAAGDRVLNLAEAQVADLGGQPVLRLRVGREGYYFLRTRPEVLSVLPEGWRDVAAPDIEDVAAYRVEAAGWSDGALLREQGVDYGNPGDLVGYMTLRLDAASGMRESTAAYARADASCRGVFDQVLAPLGGDLRVRYRDREDCFGAFAVITPAGVDRLRLIGDRRLGTLRFERPFVPIYVTSPGIVGGPPIDGYYATPAP